MTFVTRDLIKPCFEPQCDLGFKNLVVSGCSFTYNPSRTDACTWPYYLRDLGKFQQVFDSSLSGAGNYHIAQSTQWCLELADLDPSETLVIVMWSGNDRDDTILDQQYISKKYSAEFKYTNNVNTGLSGGLDEDAWSNVTMNFYRDLPMLKSKESRAVENFLYINGLYHYLKNKNYPFVFLNYLDPDVPNRSADFKIDQLLPKNLRLKYQSMFADVTDLYSWALKHDQLGDDDYHPTPDGHLEWCREILIPHLKQLNM